MKTEFEFKYNNSASFKCGAIILCADEVRRLFGVTRDPVTLVVSTIKPRGDDWYEATLFIDDIGCSYYIMTKEESGDYDEYSDWDIGLDNKIKRALNSPKKVYFWMLQ